MFLPLLSLGGEEQLQVKVHRILIPYPNTAHSQMTMVPRWISRDQINMKGDKKQDGGGERKD